MHGQLTLQHSVTYMTLKRKRSTTSLSLTIQSIITQALEDDCNAIMASIDWSAAFDMVNIVTRVKVMI